MKSQLSVLIVLLLLIGCGADKSQQGGLIVFDVNRTYPEKEILLSDIADISYVQLSEADDNYLFRGGPLCMAEQTIIVYNSANGDVLFFHRDGQPKSKFNHKGNGPGEYTFIRTNAVCYDEKKDELYVVVDNKRIDIFSSIGELKRTLPLPDDIQVSGMFLLENNSLLLFDNSIQDKYALGKFQKVSGSQTDSSQDAMSEMKEPFVRISAHNGDIQEYISLPHDYRVDLSKEIVINGKVEGILVNRVDNILKGPEGMFLHFAENDTLYLYTADRLLQPVMVQTPSMPAMDPIVYINSIFQTERYQFIELITIQLAKNNRFLSTFLVRDRSDGSIATQKIVFDDYAKKEVGISCRLINYTHQLKEGVLMIPADELRQAYDKGELSGDLQTFVASMDEERENEVIVFLRFKD